MNGGTCLRETLGKRVPRGRKKNVRCNRSSLLTNSLPYKERHEADGVAVLGVLPATRCGNGGRCRTPSKNCGTSMRPAAWRVRLPAL